MRFQTTPIVGAILVDIEPLADERGVFARTVCVEEFKNLGADVHIVQQSISWNPLLGTLRGMHYQATPFEEEKLVRVTRGAVFDVIVDLRENSSSFGRWFGVHLTASNHRQLFIPKGVAHGFQTTEENTEVFYQMTVPFCAEASRGFRWNDATLNIDWPYPELALRPGYMSLKDARYPDFAPGEAR